MTPAAMKPFDPSTVPLTGTHLVEAGAGTGKTHGLTALYLRAIAEGGLLPEQVAVVTFTDAATRELRTRVRARMTLLARRLASATAGTALPTSDDADVEALVARLAGDRARAEHVGRAALALDDAAINTIHGFCRRTLQDFAFETGVTSAELDPTEGLAIRRDAVREFWRRTVVGAAPADAAWVQSWCASPDVLEKKWLGEPLRVPESALEPAWDEAAQQEFARLGRALEMLHAQGREPAFRKSLGELLHELASAPALKRSGPYREETFAQHCEALVLWLGGDDARAAPVQALVALCRRTIAPERKRRPAMHADWLPQSTDALDWAEAAAEAASGYARARRTAFLHDAIGAVRGALARHQRENRVSTFDDLVNDLGRLLHGPGGAALRTAVRARYRIAIVDEFQDTDAAQYGIFRALFHDRADGALFLIGDPKQAIYRFRGGDVFAYRAAGEDAGANRWALTTNYRSDARLVAAVNGLFHDPKRLTSPFVHDFIGFEKSVPAARPAGVRALAAVDRPLTVWTIETAKPVYGREFAERVVRAVAAEIAALLRTHGTTLRIAVLARNRRQVRDCVVELARWNVPVSHVSEDSVFRTAEADALAVVLRALADLRDARRARAALSGAIFGGTDASLRALAQDNARWETALVELNALARLAEQQGPAALTRALAQRAGAAWLAEPEGRRRLTNLLHVGELLQAQAASLSGLEGQLEWLARQRATDGIVAELRPDSSGAPVEVMTVHKAKGLQWDVVFAPFLWNEWRPERKGDEHCLDHRMPVTYHAPRGGLRVDLGSPDWPQRAGQAEEEEAAEAVRLAYVALTRARHRCYTVWARVRKAAEISPFTWLLHQNDGAGVTGFASIDVLPDHHVALRLGEWVAAAEGAVDVRPLPEPELEPLPVSGEAAALRARPFEQRIDRRFQMLSFSGLFGAAAFERPDHDQAVVPVVGDEPGPVAATPRGARFGECVHAILERIDFADPRSLASRELVAKTCRRFRFGATETEAVARLVEDTLSAELLPGVRLGAIAPAARRAELEFFFPLDDVALDAIGRALALDPRYARTSQQLADVRPRLHGLMHGYVDLVFAHDGRYGLVDYKTNYLGSRYEDYAPDALARAVRASDYDLQYLLYSVALVRHLRRRFGAAFDYGRHYAGVAYLFVRGLAGGTGVHRDVPPRRVIDALDRAFAGEVSS